MQGGRHIGKIVITMPEDPQSLESIKEQPVPVFRPDRSYLLVGGLGGLGRAVAMWMVEHGARHLTFLSRSANPEKPAVRALLDELHSQGCDVQLVAGSVSTMADVEGAIKGSHKPIAGVINMSMVLRVRHTLIHSSYLHRFMLNSDSAGRLVVKDAILGLDDGRRAQSPRNLEPAPGPTAAREPP